ncbi:MAG: hypothetical protein IIA45_05910, partial [Bacteroidetes bacterium]|nr:hypothetical protein [Bacteroidota bacterium]
PFTSGPVYIGACMCFLFVLGLFLVNGRMRVWIIIATLLSIFLSWGRHMSWFSDLFFDYVPMFNKFRNPSMWLTITCLMVPTLGILGLNKILMDREAAKKFLITKPQFNFRNINLFKSPITLLQFVFIIVGGTTFFFVLFGSSSFDFIASSDTQLREKGWPIDALRADRANLLRMDSIRSFIFILLMFGLIWGFLKDKIHKNVLILGIAILVVVDIWWIDTRYMNEDSYTSKTDYRNQFKPNQADLAILNDKDPNYRVYNLTVGNPFTDAMTSYHHKSVGGYNAAKLIRYQDLIEKHISRGEMRVFNMLNTKYFIVGDSNNDNKPTVQANPDALGNAWFVQNIKWVADADSEMQALGIFDPGSQVVIDERYHNYMDGLNLNFDPEATITLTEFAPNRLVYECDVKGEEQFVVFSEIYYEGGGSDWESSINGEKKNHIRVNYVLRGMRVPPGQSEIVFEFKPPSYFVGEKVSMAASILLVLFMLSTFAYSLKKKDPELEEVVAETEGD